MANEHASDVREKVELLREFLHRRPFHPFRVVMRNGHRHDIVNPDKVAIGGSSAYAFLPRMVEMRENDIELIYVPRESTRHLGGKDKADWRPGMR